MHVLRMNVNNDLSDTLGRSRFSELYLQDESLVEEVYNFQLVLKSNFKPGSDI